ncbi:MAG TPA: caspase family protein [Kofleriaceae bacterium]
MALSLTVAARRIAQLEARFGPRMVAFAAAASLPVVLDVRLVHLLRINFFQDVHAPLPWTAESDLLFSSLCVDLGDGLFEMEPTIRGLLLARLRDDGGADLVRDIASLLWTYLHMRPSPWAYEPGLERAQELTALQVLDPAATELWLAQAQAAVDDSAPAERPWFVAMQRKLDSMSGLAEQRRHVDVVRELVADITRQCARLLELDVLQDLRPPLYDEVEAVRNEVSRILDRLVAFGLEQDEELLAFETIVYEMHSALTQARFVLLYSVLLRLPYTRQVVEARAAGWGSKSAPDLLIAGPPGYGHNWLAARLAGERNESVNSTIFTLEVSTLDDLRSRLRDVPKTRRGLRQLSMLTQHDADDVAAWQEKYFTMPDALVPLLRWSSNDLPERALLDLGRQQGLDEAALAERVARAPVVDLVEHVSETLRNSRARPPDSDGRRVIATIGIDRYPKWPPLHNAVHDALAVRRVFEQLGFEAGMTLLDDEATGVGIRSLIVDELISLGPNDNLVLFYAGHGTTRVREIDGTAVKTGYLVPVDASDTRVSTWVELESLLRDVARLPARHILVILDACHAGIALSPVIRWRSGASQDARLDVLRTRRSRRIITSALDDQRALDSGPFAGHSLFAGCLIEALTGGLSGLAPGGRSVVTGSELAIYVQRRVQTYPGAHQTPDFGTFELDDRGEMLIPLLVE